ncbi:MAG: PEP-CTERM sorting domain-containing protein [Planctomycetota bacterium]
MKAKIAIASAVVAYAGLATGQLTHTYDISGLSAEGGFGAEFPTLTHDFGVAGSISQIDYDVTWESFDPSFGSEFVISIDTDLGNFFEPVTGAANAPGVYSYVDTVTFLPGFDSDGIVFLTLYETFSDAISPNATVSTGSVTVTYIPVPAPASAALLGAGGLLAARRRR